MARMDAITGFKWLAHSCFDVPAAARLEENEIDAIDVLKRLLLASVPILVSYGEKGHLGYLGLDSSLT